MGGEDVLRGNEGNDTLCGGDGDDFILGGEVYDTIQGNQGDDSIDSGRGGIDQIIWYDGDNNDTIQDDSGANDKLTIRTSGNPADIIITQPDEEATIVSRTAEMPFLITMTGIEDVDILPA
jgi:hypothetical protein